MTYRERVNRGADSMEIQAYLLGGDMHSATIRIPDNLRNVAAEEAKLSGISFSAYLHMCLIDTLSSEGASR